jgi:iron(III) transport system ATP-binding protein
MDKGRMLQFATPSQLYREPADATVARFIGEGVVVPARVLQFAATATCDVGHFGIGCRCAAGRPANGAAQAVCAPQRCGSRGRHSGLAARVTATTYQGGHFRVDARSRRGPTVALHFTIRSRRPSCPGTTSP